MGNIDSDANKEMVLDLSKNLNQLITNYREKTILISSLLEQEDDDIVFRIEELLDQREMIIKQYETLNHEVEQQVNITGKGSEELELKKLGEIRREMFLSIEKIDSNNREKINKLYNVLKEKMHQISDSKKVINVYHAIHPMADGVYFDKRK